MKILNESKNLMYKILSFFNVLSCIHLQPLERCNVTIYSCVKNDKIYICKQFTKNRFCMIHQNLYRDEHRLYHIESAYTRSYKKINWTISEKSQTELKEKGNSIFNKEVMCDFL